MEIDDDELAVRARYGQIAHKQAALEVCRAHGPAKGAGQRYALGRIDIIDRRCQKSAVYPAYGRDGVGYELAGIIECVCTVVYAQSVGLVLTVGARGVFVHLLQHEDRCRFGVGIKRFIYSQKRSRNGVLVGGGDVAAAIHKEIGALAETGIADVPAYDRKFLIQKRL